MTAQVERVFQIVRTLSPSEQLELIQVISQALQHQYQQTATKAIPPDVKRTAPILSIAQLGADFWPADESADDINAYIAQQRYL